MRRIILLLFCITILSCNTKPKEAGSTTEHAMDGSAAKEAILKVMQDQENAWNKGDLEGFMQGYWKNDSLKFFGRNGLTKGWQNTLNNYKKGYPSSKEIGTLEFVVIDISPIEYQSYWVMGEYHLTREAGNTSGVFTIIFKRINGEWKIVSDMSC